MISTKIMKEKCNPGKKIKFMLVFDDMIPVMISNKNLHPMVSELFFSGRKLNISLLFITQSR